MNRILIGMAALCLLVVGCGEKAGTNLAQNNQGAAPDGATKVNNPPGDATPSDEKEKAPTAVETTAAGPIRSDLKPVAIENGSARLGPENAKIQFIGKHTDSRPDRVGGFEQFSGQANVDPASGTLKSVSVEIDTASLWTQFPNLTTHLNSPDFFDTREHPKAKFESTRITPENASAHGGQCTITGNFTLLGTTKEVSFPAIVQVTDDGLTVQADFVIDRTEFGMDRLQEAVQKPVSIGVVVGQKTEPQKTAG